MGKVHLRVANGHIVREFDGSGKLVAYCGGDWFQIQNKQRARELIETGQAILPGAEEARKEIIGDFADAGILVRGGTEEGVAHITGKYPELSVEIGDMPILPFERTLFLDPSFPMLPELAAIGLGRIENLEGPHWEAAAMLRGHNYLAKKAGNDADRKGTLELFGDLRLPVYSPEAVWVRKTRKTEAFVRAWAMHIDNGVGEEHALIRALYAHRVVLCTLPVGWLATWLGKRQP